MNLKQFQKKMRKKFKKASSREVKLMISSFIVLLLSVVYAADRLLVPLDTTKAGFKVGGDPILVIMAFMIMMTLVVILYFGTRYNG